MAEIDRLEVQIEAQATKANSALEKLAGKLDTIAKSLSGVNGSGLTGFANGVQRLGNAMQAINNVKTADITRITNELKKFTEIDSSKLYSTSSAINNLSKSMSSIGNVTFNAEALNSLANAVSKFGSKMSTQATANLPQIQRDLTTFVQGMNSIGSVNFNMTGLVNLISSINKLGGKSATQATANLPNISRDLRQFISGLNGLQSISFDMSGLSSLVSSISKLGGKSVTNAVTNIPLLATALKNLMTTLSTAPTVSSNLIQMTNALAELASQGNRAGSASNSLIGSLRGAGSAMGSTKKQALSLASALGGLYANFYLIINSMKKLWSSIESSMDYVETLNYFNAAFGQVAEVGVSKWQEAGYDSAEAYYDSFSKRAEQLTQKMTGFTVTDSGMLEATGTKNLGIDPEKLMNYQSVFGQMSSSMGVTSENALLLSNVLTEIGADLASVKNMDFDKVWNDMASGLAGMSRTLDKYGVNIRNVNLQQKLNELGINANITALNQNDKALLRTIILLDSTKYAWGDMSETINQPANQLRLMQSNLSNLARTIGNIFLPIVAKALPYINGFIIAIQRLAESIVKLLGFEDFEWGGLGGTGSTDVDLSSLYDDADNLTDGLDNASKAAKKLKGNLQGFDELNNITTNDSNSDSGSGSGLTGIQSGLLDEAFKKAVSEYQAAWDKAFEGMEQKAQSVADNIIKAFKSGDYKGIGTYISTGLTNALNSIPWNTIYSGARSFGTGLAQFFNGLITPELFGAVGKTVASSLNTAIYVALSFGQTFDFSNLGKSIGTGVTEFFKTFDFKSLAETINVWVNGIETLIWTALTTTDWGQVIGGAMDFIGTLDLDTIAIAIGAFAWFHGGSKLTADLFKSLLGKQIGITGAAESGTVSLGATIAISAITFKVGFDIGKEIGKLLFPEDAEYYDDFSWKEFFGTFTDGSWLGAIEESVNEAIPILGMPFSVILAKGTEVKDKIKEKFTELTPVLAAPFTAGISKAAELKTSISDKWKNIKTNTETAWNNVREKVDTAITKAKTTVDTKADNIKSTVSTKWSDIKTNTETAWNNTKEKIDTAIDKAKTTVDTKAEGIKSTIATKWENVKTKTSTAWENIKANVTTAIDKAKTTVDTKAEGIRSTIETKFESARKNVETVTGKMTEYLGNVWSGIESGLSAAWSNGIEAVKKLWNSFAKWINEKLTIKFDTSTVIGKGISEILGRSTISLGTLPTFATGGFPEDGLFMANHGELVGKFANGKTAVANNKQITDGIAIAVQNANSEQNQLLRQQNELLLQILQKETGISGNAIFESVRKSAKEYSNRTGRPAFDY